MAGVQYIGTARIGPSGSPTYTGTAGTYTVCSQTYKVRVLVTTDAWVTTDGTTPSSSAGAYMPALEPEYFTVTPGQTVKAVQVSTGGTLNVVECV